MNVYPGSGLGLGTAVLGSLLGQSLSVAGTGGTFTLCKIHGRILNMAGEPVGAMSSSLVTVGGVVTLTETWKGVSVTAGITGATDSSGSVIGVDRISTLTDATGYFELYVIQGLVVSISSPSFGKSVTVDTTGLDTIDLSTFF